jgi:hypothetical protein
MKLLVLILGSGDLVEDNIGIRDADKWESDAGDADRVGDRLIAPLDPMEQLCSLIHA